MEGKCTNVSVVYYSPTHTSEKIAEAIASGITEAPFNVVNLTTDGETAAIEIAADWVVLVAPVYAGRIPVEAAERFKRVQIVGKEGVPTKAVVAVVYGNRDYDDALLELQNIAEELGLLPVAGGAFIGEHSFSRENMPIGEGRPDNKDLEIAKSFGEKACQVLSEDINQKKLYVKGNTPYCAHMEIPPVCPESTAQCNVCGKCVNVCPIHAIKVEDRCVVTDAEACTLCCACVKMCPNDARVFDTPFTKMLFENCKERKEPELFYINC